MAEIELIVGNDDNTYCGEETFKIPGKFKNYEEAESLAKEIKEIIQKKYR